MVARISHVSQSVPTEVDLPAIVACSDLLDTLEPQAALCAVIDTLRGPRRWWLSY